jgi:hypothetical protein
MLSLLALGMLTMVQTMYGQESATNEKTEYEQLIPGSNIFSQGIGYDEIKLLFK